MKVLCLDYADLINGWMYREPEDYPIVGVPPVPEDGEVGVAMRDRTETSDSGLRRELKATVDMLAGERLRELHLSAKGILTKWLGEKQDGTEVPRLAAKRSKPGMQGKPAKPDRQA